MKRALRFVVLILVLLMSFTFIASAAYYHDGDKTTYVYKDCPAFHDGTYPGETSTSDGACYANKYLNRLYWYNGYAINMLHMDNSKYPAQYDGKTYFYCIFPWKHYSRTSDYYEIYTDPTGQGDITRSDYWMSLSTDQRKLLELASMFGFPARTPQELGVSTADDAYAATQCIIWEIISGRRTYWGLLTPELYHSSDFERANGLSTCVDNPYYYYDNYMHYPYNENGHYVGQATTGLTAYLNIEQSIHNFNTLASFANQTLTLNWDSNTGTYRGTFTDTNNVIKDSYLCDYSLPSGVQCQKNGNTVTFITSQPLASSAITFVKTPPMYTEAPLAVLDVGDGGQQFMCGCANDPKYFSFNIQTDGGTLCIRQSSEDNIVSGFHFHITGNGVDTVLSTGSNGQCNVSLKNGTYTVQQLDTPCRYIKPTTYTATVYGGQTTTVWSYNYLRRKDLVIHSSSEDGVGGAQYRVTGNGVDRIVGTDSSGTAIVPDLVLGKYTVTEVYTPSRYVQPASQTVILAAGESSLQDGGIYYIYNVNSNKVIDVEGSNSADGTNISQFTEKGSANQQWKVHYEGGGVYTLESMSSGSLLSINGSSPNSGANCWLWHNDGTSGQKFKIRTNSDGTFTILSQCSGDAMALDVSGSSLSNGGNIQQWYDNGSGAQKWCFIPAKSDPIEEGGIYNILAKHSGKCINVDGSKTADGTNISQYAEKDSPSQQWQVHYEGGGVYTLRSVSSGKLLSIYGSSPNSGANCWLWHNDGTSGQRFRISRNGDGSYSILSQCSGYQCSLDVDNSSTADGANIRQNQYAMTDNQCFYFNRTYETVSFYNSVIKSRVKFVDRCTYYHGYISGATYGIYRADGTYTGNDLISDANRWVYSPLLYYGNYYLQEKTPAENYALDTAKYPFSITQNGVYASITVDNTPTSDVYPIIVQPNAAYHAATDVIVSYYIHNNSIAERTTDRPLSVSFTASTDQGAAASQTVQVVVPRFSENLVFFKVSLPVNCTWVKFNCTIASPSGVVETNTANNNASKTYPVVKNIESETPDTQFEDTPSDFTKPSDTAVVPTGGNPAISSARWEQWSYENSAFTLKQYGVTLETSHRLSADTNAFSSYQSEGQLHLRSGYGFSLNEHSGMGSYQSCLLPDASSYILPQNGNAYFPEFNYSSDAGNYRTLEKAAANTLEFEQNPHSMKTDGTQDNRRIHFTPIWYPDGDYTVKTFLYDCWTPAGMLATSNTLDPIRIEGNMYDDWIVNHTDK